MQVELNKEQQGEVLSHMNQFSKLAANQATDYNDQMLSIYESLSTMEMPDTGDNLTRFKINKAHEVLRKVVPRVAARPPSFLASPRTDIFYPEDEDKVLEDRTALLERNNKYARAVQDYLHSIFRDEQFVKRLKIWAVKGLTYGNAFCQVIPKYKIQRKKGKNGIEEHVVGVTPTIDPVSWTEMKYDARYLFLEDMPGIIRERKKVSKFSIYNNEDYFNLELIDKLGSQKYSDMDQYANRIYEITGVKGVQVSNGLSENDLTLQTYEGYYSLTGKPQDTKMYEFTSISGALLVGAKEITQLSFVDFKGHEDPEVFHSVGLIAPIMGVTDELNFQKNSQATAMSKSLNRSYLWAPESGVDPSQLFNDKAGAILVCNNGVEAAQRNLVEMQDRQLPAQYFSNVNDYNRDIQTLSHTTDVSSPGGQNALTNTATGARISFFESNAVIAELRKNYERAVQELGYKILDWTANNIDKDIVIKKANSSEFIKINIEAIRDAVERYDITVEANSSSFDDLENRRADALALKDILIQAGSNGVDVDMEEGFRKVFSTFEQVDVDKLIKKEEGVGGISALLGGAGGKIPGGNEPTNTVPPTSPEGLTQAVAGGSLNL